MKFAELTRIFECDPSAYAEGWQLDRPWFGDDYFEAVSLLQAVLRASPARFRAIEIGSSWGVWAVRAAVAWHRLHPDGGDCEIVLIEVEEERLAEIPQHLNASAVDTYCRVRVVGDYITAPELDVILRSLGEVDLLDSDAQGSELTLLGDATELSLVKQIFVGTHGRWIHRALRNRFEQLGFLLDFDVSPVSVVETPFGPWTGDDGMLIVSRK